VERTLLVAAREITTSLTPTTNSVQTTSSSSDAFMLRFAGAESRVLSSVLFLIRRSGTHPEIFEYDGK